MPNFRDISFLNKANVIVADLWSRFLHSKGKYTLRKKGASQSNGQEHG